jgi:hypothetical protein
MKKLLRKLFFWLFEEDFQAMEKKCKDLDGLIHRQKCATQEAEVRAERIRKLMGNIDVSVDVQHRSGSWAVVSLQGAKTDYIKFIDLGSRDMMEIARFLRQYDRANVKIDASPFDRHMMNEEIYRL